MDDLRTRASELRITEQTFPVASAAAGAPASYAPDESALPPRSALRSAPPAWVELLPAGVFHGRDGRGPFRLSDPAAVVAATTALGMEAGIPIDYDHATDFGAPLGAPAPAAGWIRELQVRDGAIWGRVEWTERAAAAIAAREYRYLSPVFQYDPESGAVTRLLRAGLTNNPNLHLTAIATAAHLTAAAKDDIMDDFLDKLRALLDNDADAPSDVNAAHPDPARYVAVAEFQKALTGLNTIRAERAREKAELAVDAAIRAGKIIPAQGEWAIAYCAADPRGFQTFAAHQPVIVAGESGLGSDPAWRVARGILSSVETAICTQLGVKRSDYLRRKHGGDDFLRLGRNNAER